MSRRHRVQRLGFILLGVISLIVVLPILFVVGNIVVQGIGAINWEFLTTMPRNGMKEGGIFPAIVGTLLLVLGTAVVAIPVGIGGAIYLAEYARDTFWTRILRLAIINLAGVPPSSTASSAWDSLSSSCSSALRSWPAR